MSAPPSYSPVLAAVFSWLLFVLNPVTAQAQTNAGFESGLKGWTLLGAGGHVTLDHHHPYQGKNAAKITGYGGLAFRMNATPLSIIQFNIWISSEKAGMRVYPFIRFYDSADRRILELKSKTLSYLTWQSAGNYTETPAIASWMEIGLETDAENSSDANGNPGIVYTDNLTVTVNPGTTLPKHPFLGNIDRTLLPFWHTDTVYNETVLLFAPRGKPAGGRLLYTPEKILSVKNFDETRSFSQDTDFTLRENEITRTGNSLMPFKADTFFNTRKNFAWYDLQSQWIVVTYTHKDAWEGPTPVYKGDQLPKTMSRLRTGASLNIVAYGMSITRGLDVSGYDNVPPYMPNYMDLFAQSLEKRFAPAASVPTPASTASNSIARTAPAHPPPVPPARSFIHLYNAGLPGSLVSWGADYADKYVSPLKPNLVILDFGMNDFWRYTPSEFKDYIAAMIRKIKADAPDAEFILLSNMMFDPDYILDSDDKKKWYLANMRGYSKSLQELEGKGIVNLDMLSLSEAIYARKKAKDCLSNPLHPNDYLARWYAQGLAALFQAPD